MQFAFSEATIKSLLAYSFRGSKGTRITRKFMYQSLKDKLKNHDLEGKSCLVISHSENLAKILGLVSCRYTQADYPEHNILSLRFDDDTFDFCVSDQVFEHIEGNPFTAFEETARVTKPGGFICHTTCFINPVHGAPKDFWRFTKDALELLAVSAGCLVVDAGAWGNREAWALIHAGFRTARIPDDKSHPLFDLAMRNEPGWPIVTWIVARKQHPSSQG